jgi:two-component system sensor histidine kinase AlgZ
VFTHRPRLLLYLAAWAPAGVLMAVLFGDDAQPGRSVSTLALFVPLVLVLAAAALSMDALCRSFPLHSTPPVKVIAVSLASGVAFGIFWMLAAKLLAVAYDALELAPGLGTWIDARIPALFLVALLAALLAVAVHYTLNQRDELAAARNREVEALAGAREAELRALRAQVNPHFLFNTLNSISALIGSDAERARRMCALLADFLRSTLSLGERATISLAEEVTLARNYLAVEKVRFGSRLEVIEEIEPDCLACPVPPLLLQPLVENAVKHGIGSLLDGGVVRIEARRSPRFLRVAVENGFDAESPARARGGLGLANVRGRLAARYGDDARLEAGRKGDLYRAEILMPAREA